MAGRPPKVDHVRNGLLSEANSARNLVARVLALPRGVREGELHPKHARQIVELAFMGVVSAWDEFLERTLVRYVAGAVTDSGYAPTAYSGSNRPSIPEQFVRGGCLGSELKHAGNNAVIAHALCPHNSQIECHRVQAMDCGQRQAYCRP